MTTLGLLSDTHGRADTAAKAVELLLRNGVDMLIHTGDIGTIGVIDAMAVKHPKSGKSIEVHMVFGNTDWEAKPLEKYANDLGMHVHDPAGQIEVDGKQIAFSHGHLTDVMRHLFDSKPDYVVHGHTHVVADNTYGQMRVINPGALFRAARHTVALLQPSTGHLEVLELASDEAR